MGIKIAIQGIQGSFHHQVAHRYFGEAIGLDECSSFRDVVNSLKTNQSDKAVMAIENSIAGAILPNYALIDSNDLHIIGEYFLDIHMNLSSTIIYKKTSIIIHIIIIIHIRY